MLGNFEITGIGRLWFDQGSRVFRIGIGLVGAKMALKAVFV